MNTQKRTVGAVACAVVLTACGGAAEQQPEAAAPSAATPAAAGSASPSAAADGEVGCPEAEGKTVGYSQPLPDPNFALIDQVIGTALGEYGAELVSTNANLDPGKQVSDVQSLLQQGVSVLIANPIDPNATRPVFDRARSQDVPIIAQETTVGGPFFTNVTADVESAARQGAELLAAEVGPGGKVTALEGPALAEVLVRENKAFAAGAQEAGLDVVDTQVNQMITPEGARAIGDAWRQEFGADLKGIWTFNDTSAVGVASAFSGGEAPAIVSINGQPEAIPLVESGQILATFDLQQDRIGQALAYAALAALCDQEVPEEIVVPVTLIDASTVGSYRPLAERVKDPFEVVLEERDGRSYVAD